MARDRFVLGVSAQFTEHDPEEAERRRKEREDFQRGVAERHPKWEFQLPDQGPGG